MQVRGISVIYSKHRESTRKLAAVIVQQTLAETLFTYTERLTRCATIDFVKRCSKCVETKPVSEFNKNRNMHAPV